jgi:hypothetical protein
MRLLIIGFAIALLSTYIGLGIRATNPPLARTLFVVAGVIGVILVGGLLRML